MRIMYLKLKNKYIGMSLKWGWKGSTMLHLRVKKSSTIRIQSPKGNAWHMEFNSPSPPPGLTKELTERLTKTWEKTGEKTMEKIDERIDARWSILRSVIP